MAGKPHEPDTPVDAEVVDDHDVAPTAESNAIEVRPAHLPAKDISPEARLLRGVFRVAGMAVGTAVRTGQFAVETTAEVGKQIAQVAEGETDIDIVGFAGERLRGIARTALGVTEPVREVVRYVPVPAPEAAAGAATPVELRRRGDQLLRQSADLSFTDEVHPAYSRILGELAPDEARILRYLALNGPQPSVDIRTNRPLGIGSELIAGDLTSVPAQSHVRHAARARSYLINLKRLGLVHILSEPVLLSRYMMLEVQPIVTEALGRAGRAPKIVRKSLLLTEFGEDFCRTCFTLPPHDTV